MTETRRELKIEEIKVNSKYRVETDDSFWELEGDKVIESLHYKSCNTCKKRLDQNSEDCQICQATEERYIAAEIFIIDGSDND